MRCLPNMHISCHLCPRCQPQLNLTLWPELVTIVSAVKHVASEHALSSTTGRRAREGADNKIARARQAIGEILDGVQKC